MKSTDLLKSNWEFFKTDNTEHIQPNIKKKHFFFENLSLVTSH